MPFMNKTSYGDTGNILASEVGLWLVTEQGLQSDATDVDGCKVIKAGSLWSKTDGEKTDIGVVFEDVDMTHDTKRPISVVKGGRVRADRVAAEVTAKADDFIKQGLYLVEKEA